MHIYTINIDAAPLFDGVAKLLEEAGFARAYLHVNGLFTATTIRSCLYGKTFDSVAPDDLFLIDALIDRGFRVAAHEDHVQFTRQYLGEEPDLRRREGTSYTLGEVVPALRNERYGDVVISTSGRAIGRRFRDFLDPRATAAFMEKERRFIEGEQSASGDRYLHLLQSHYHDLAFYSRGIPDPGVHLPHTAERVAEWLGFWDFDEPDALFFVFSDHGDQVERLTPPKDYLRWCFFRDNTSDPVRVAPKLVTGIDLFPTLLRKIGHPLPSDGYACRSFEEPLDPERIYHSADMRLWDRNRRDKRVDERPPDPDNPSSDAVKLLNGTAMKIVDWTGDGDPATLLQATYYLPTDRFYYAFYDFDPESPVYRFGRFAPAPHAHVPITRLADRSRLWHELALLSESLLSQFPWIGGSYREDLETGTLPDWFSP